MNPAASTNAVHHVLITGGTGFIGSALAQRLLNDGIRVSILSRERERALAHFAGRVGAVESLRELARDKAPDVIVNLAGKNLGEQRWNRKVKQALIASRVGVTEQVVDYIAQAKQKPALLINGSAVGYYGARGTEALTEDAKPTDEFQSLLCQRWEAMAERD